MHQLALSPPQLNTMKAIKKDEVRQNFLNKSCKNLSFWRHRRIEQL